MFLNMLFLFLFFSTAGWTQNVVSTEKPLPYQKKITEIISSIEYSGFEIIITSVSVVLGHLHPVQSN